jgi:hypothetical protein
MVKIMKQFIGLSFDECVALAKEMGRDYDLREDGCLWVETWGESDGADLWFDEAGRCGGYDYCMYL